MVSLAVEMIDMSSNIRNPTSVTDARTANSLIPPRYSSLSSGNAVDSLLEPSAFVGKPRTEAGASRSPSGFSSFIMLLSCGTAMEN